MAIRLTRRRDEEQQDRSSDGWDIHRYLWRASNWVGPTVDSLVNVMDKIKAFFAAITNQIGVADIAIAVAVSSLVVGLWMVYSPLGFILPAILYLVWEAFRRWPRKGR